MNLQLSHFNLLEAVEADINHAFANHLHLTMKKHSLTILLISGWGGGGGGGSNPLTREIMKNNVKGFNPKYKIIS